MYEEMMKDVQENMKPVVDMAEINKKAVERLIELQSSYVTDFVNATMAQMQALSSIKDPQEAIELQVDYVKQLETKLSSVAEEEMAALNSAKDELTAIIETSFAGFGLKDTNYFEDLSKFMTPAATESTAKPAAKATPAKKAAAPKAAAPKPTAKKAAAPAAKKTATPAAAPTAKAAKASEPAPVEKATTVKTAEKTAAPAPTAKKTDSAK